MFIREMDIGDMERIIELESQLFSSSSWTASDFMYEILENAFSYNYVLEIDHYIIGYVGFWVMYEQSQITTIGIDSKYQGQGLGKFLMNEVIDYVKTSGCQVMSLEVRISNEPAIHLYESLGFTKEAIRKNYYQDNHEDAHLMVKRLEG